MVISSPWPIDCSTQSRSGPTIGGIPLSMMFPPEARWRAIIATLAEWEVGGCSGAAVAAVGEEFRTFGGQREEVGHGGIDVGPHGGRGGRSIAGGDGGENLLMLGDRDGEAARGDGETAGAIEIGAGRFDDSLQLVETHPGLQQRVEGEVELVEALTVDHGVLVIEVLAQRRNQRGGAIVD